MTPEQQEIMDLIAKVWAVHPEYRFGQLIGIALGPGDTYHVLNDTFEQRFRLTYYRDL